MKAYELIDGGFYKVGNEIVFFSALNGCLYKKDGESSVYFGRIFRDTKSGDLEVPIQLEWKKLEPIPFTAEIFEKNGWNKSSDGGWHTLTTKDNIYLEYHWGTNRIAIREVLGVTEMVFLKGKRFVHELQHTLLLCGLNELAENFKVE